MWVGVIGEEEEGYKKQLMMKKFICSTAQTMFTITKRCKNLKTQMTLVPNT